MNLDCRSCRTSISRGGVNQSTTKAKYFYKTFVDNSNQNYNTRQNQSLHSTLNNVARDKSIKICWFNKENGVAILNGHDYFNWTQLLWIPQNLLKLLSLTTMLGQSSQRKIRLVSKLEKI